MRQRWNLSVKIADKVFNIAPRNRFMQILIRKLIEDLFELKLIKIVQVHVDWPDFELPIADCKWATPWQNQSDQSLRCPHEESLGP